MRFSPTKFLHGLLCMAPVLVLTLAACGGGGGGDSTPAPTYSLGGAASGVTGTGGLDALILKNTINNDTVTVASGATSYVFGTKLTSGSSYNITVQQNPSSHVCSVANATGTMTSAGVANANVTCLPSYTLGGGVSGLAGTTGFVLRNNGGDDLSITTNSPYVFATQVAGGDPYNITVLSQPTSPNQICDFSGSPTFSGTMPSSSITNANVTCVSSYSIGGSTAGGFGVIGLTGNLLLKNTTNGDILPVAGSGDTDFTFSTLLKNSTAYSVTVLKDPYGQDCHTTSANTSGSTSGSNVTNVNFTCVSASPPLLDQYAYVANFNDNTISAYDITQSGGTAGLPTPFAPGFDIVTGLSNPSSIVVNLANTYAYVTNYGSNTIATFSISTGHLVTPKANVATGAGPYSIRLHPTGKYAYVVNYLAGTVSGYSIDASGTLASIDTDGDTAATQTSITTGGTGTRPIAIAIHPGGGYAYVVNSATSTIRGYIIDPHTGALSFDRDYTTGLAGPFSITIDPTGRYAYVANSGSASISGYTIAASGVLSPITCSTIITTACSGANFPAGTTPRSVTIHPSGKFVYVANSGSSSVSAYKIDDTTGQLIPVSALPYYTEASPISISIDNSGSYAYVAHYSTSPTNVWTFTINTSSGVLSNPQSVAAGYSPNSIATAR